MSASIYKIKNLVNGKSYIGFTTQLETRWEYHRTANDLTIHKAIRKYGLENFEFSVLYTSDDVDHTKNMMEGEFIREHMTHASMHGYNMTFGGEGQIGWVPSQETRSRISQALQGRSSPKSKYDVKELAEVRSSRSKRLHAGSFWITDGVTDKRLSFSMRGIKLPDGWVMGRTKIENLHKIVNGNPGGANTKGRKIYNNGLKHAYFFPDAVPEGWVSGKMVGFQGGTGAMKGKHNG